jgi:hypothetical protein
MATCSRLSGAAVLRRSRIMVEDAS